MQNSSNNDTNVFVLSVMLTVVSVVGIIGNLIVATVYWQKKDKQTSTFFILVLSFSDLCVCSVLIPLTIYMEQTKYITNSMLLCRLFYFLTTSIVPASCLIMTAIAFDRFFCICMVRHNIMTQQRARLLVVAILLCSGLMGVVPSWNTTLDKVQYQDNCLNGNHTATTDAASVSSSSQPLLINNDGDADANMTNAAALAIAEASIQQISAELPSSSLSSHHHLHHQQTTSMISPVPSHLECPPDTAADGAIEHRISLNNGSYHQCTLINFHILETFKRFYDALYGCSALIISFLYILIYKDVYTRRKNKRIRKSTLLHSQRVNGGGAVEQQEQQQNLMEKKEAAATDKKWSNGETEQQPKTTTARAATTDDLNSVDSNTRRKSKDSTAVKKPMSASLNNAAAAKLNSHRRRSLPQLHNMISTKDIRTAFMLFVVTILFMVLYLPSLLYTYGLMPPQHLFILYLYFINSSLNPMIYCFMNPNFRRDLVKMFFKRDSFLAKCAQRLNIKAATVPQ